MTLRKGWLLFGWCFIAFVVYLSLAPHTINLGRVEGVKAGHLVAYAWLMLWFSQALRLVYSRAALAISLALMGVALEYLQAMVGRDFAYLDMRDNTLGVLSGWLAASTPAGRVLELLERTQRTRPS